MADPGNIFDVADRFRRELLQRERQAATELVRAYGAAWQRIKARLDELGERIAADRAAGQEVRPGWLFQFERLETLQRQVEAEIGEFSRFADRTITAAQREAVAAAQQNAEQLVLAGLRESPAGVTVGFNRLSPEAVTDLVGFLQDGSPLRDILAELGPAASGGITQELITGLATGQHPTQIARQIRQELGGNLVRALRIARTETLRAYRESSRRMYQANSDVIGGWVWHSAANARTCAACWALHGTVHGLDERMDDHVNGRCAMVPLTKSWASWADLGFQGIPDNRPTIERGADLFAKQSETVQRAVLGPAAFAAYRAGAVQLEDFVGRRTSRRWGTMRYERSLREILGSEDAATR